MKKILYGALGVLLVCSISVKAALVEDDTKALNKIYQDLITATKPLDLDQKAFNEDWAPKNKVTDYSSGLIFVTQNKDSVACRALAEFAKQILLWITSPEKPSKRKDITVDDVLAYLDDIHTKIPDAPKMAAHVAKVIDHITEYAKRPWLINDLGQALQVLKDADPSFGAPITAILSGPTIFQQIDTKLTGLLALTKDELKTISDTNAKLIEALSANPNSPTFVADARAAATTWGKSLKSLYSITLLKLAIDPTFKEKLKVVLNAIHTQGLSNSLDKTEPLSVLAKHLARSDAGIKEVWTKIVPLIGKPKEELKKEDIEKEKEKAKLEKEAKEKKEKEEKEKIAKDKLEKEKKEKEKLEKEKLEKLPEALANLAASFAALTPKPK
jgi:hypothetical protein